jgi:hypothetical protein
MQNSKQVKQVRDECYSIAREIWDLTPAEECGADGVVINDELCSTWENTLRLWIFAGCTRQLKEIHQEIKEAYRG